MDVITAPPETPAESPPHLPETGRGGPALWCYVRYGKMLHHAFCETSLADLRPREAVVARTPRGTEMAEVVTRPVAERPAKVSGRVLRRPSDRDRQSHEHSQARARDALRRCQDLTEHHKLPMKVLEVDPLLGGEMVTFYFASESRVDFRDLVRDLAQEYRTRIDLRQIGARDRARLLGDIGHCGLTLCCRSHLTEYAPITMRMARVQKTSLRTQKISGVCGRLLCCLRYEHVLYETLSRKLPPRGARVKTPQGEAMVLDLSILSQEIRVLLSDRSIVSIPVAQIEVVRAAPPRHVDKDPSEEQDDGEVTPDVPKD